MKRSTQSCAESAVKAQGSGTANSISRCRVIFCTAGFCWLKFGFGFAPKQAAFSPKGRVGVIAQGVRDKGR